MRYFYHPESESLWTQADDEPVVSDGLVEELTSEEYHARVGAPDGLIDAVTAIGDALFGVK